MILLRKCICKILGGLLKQWYIYKLTYFINTNFNALSVYKKLKTNNKTFILHLKKKIYFFKFKLKKRDGLKLKKIFLLPTRVYERLNNILNFILEYSKISETSQIKCTSYLLLKYFMLTFRWTHHRYYNMLYGHYWKKDFMWTSLQSDVFELESLFCLGLRIREF